MAGMTPEGLVIKRLPDVIESLRQEATPIFEDLVEPGDVVDTSDSSTLGRIIGLISGELYDLWEALQGVDWAYNVNTAQGTALDNLVMLAGITRRGEEPTTADIYIEGNSGGSITTGMQIRSSLSGNTYRVRRNVALDPQNCLGIGINIPTPITAGNYVITYRPSHSAVDFTITVAREAGETKAQAFTKITNEINDNHPLLRTYLRDGRLFITGNIDFQLFTFSVSTPILIEKVVASAVVVSTTPGPVEEPIGVLNIIATPSLAWDYVWNPFAASVGSFRETDEALRIRFRDTKFQRATNIIESLYTALYSLDGVEEVLILENDSDTTDGYGNPPHSFLVIVEGGLNSSIAQEIWRNRPIGITSNGDIEVDLLDSFGFIRSSRFSRPEYTPIYVELSLTKGPTFPTDGEDQIREAIVAAINEYGIGQDVIYSRLYSPINSVPGHQVDTLELGIDPGTLAPGNVVIPFDGKAIISKENIVFI